jgi:DivIVA domain-containing protein
MTSRVSPDQIRSAEFRTTLRGLDAAEVGSYLRLIADEMQRLLEEHNRLQGRLGEFADRDLKTEFEQVGREVTAVLEEARSAAEAMRERATLDAARWRSEAMAETEALRKDARNDAEALRGDAWTTGSELLTQTMTEIKRLRQEAERDVLTITGEAEREAHRLVSTSRREAEDVLRAATMDAEKVTADAAKRRDDIIDQAQRQAAGAEERTRALEQRREELLEELENVRATLNRLEGTLDERREDLNLSKEPSGSVRIIPGAGPRELEGWELGETVRVVPGEIPESKPAVRIIPAGQSPESEAEPPLEEQDEESVEAPVAEPEPPVATEAASAPEPVAEDPPAPVVTHVEHEDATEDDVGALFASLRGEKPPPDVVDPEPALDPAPPVPTLEPATDADRQWLEDRDSRLLPITNRGLRGVKKAVTDAQNLALDSLRTDAQWVPDAAGLADGMRADLIGTWAEAYAAGHTAAEEMVGKKLKRPVTPASDAAEMFGDALADAVSEALVTAGDGQRERQSATSRVFRAWRTDEAERRLRELAHRGFHLGLAQSAPSAELHWVTAGVPCSACRAASIDPRATLPPVHAGCECTVIIGR